MCSAHTSPAARSSFSVAFKTSCTSSPLRSTPTILYTMYMKNELVRSSNWKDKWTNMTRILGTLTSKDLIFSRLQRSSVWRSLSVMTAPVTARWWGFPIIVTPEQRQWIMWEKRIWIDIIINQSNSILIKREHQSVSTHRCAQRCLSIAGVSRQH